MKKALVILSITAGLATLNSCCGSKPAPVAEAPVYVAPAK